MFYGVAGQLTEGDLWDADDPVVREHPDWFSDDLEPIIRRSVPKVESPVEQATAAPGEKRPTRRAR